SSVGAASFGGTRGSGVDRPWIGRGWGATPSARAGMRGLRVLLLGRPRLELDGQALAADLPRKHQALVFYLAAVGRPTPRAELASLLWEDLDEAAARGNLRTALMRLRRSLPGVLAVDGRQVEFDPVLPLHVDLTALADAADGQGDRIT